MTFTAKENDISVLLNLACLKHTGQTLPCMGETDNDWTYRVNLIAGPHAGKKYAFLKDKITIDPLPIQLRAVSNNPIELQVKRRIVTDELSMRFNFNKEYKDPIKEMRVLCQEWDDWAKYHHDAKRRLRNPLSAHHYDYSGQYSVELDGSEPWMVKFVRDLFNKDYFEQSYRIHFLSVESRLDPEIGDALDHYWWHARPTLCYLVNDLPSNNSASWVSRFKQLDRKLIELRRNLSSSTFQPTNTIQKLMRNKKPDCDSLWDNDYAFTVDFFHTWSPKTIQANLQYTDKPNGVSCFYTASNNLKKNKKIRRDWIETHSAYSRIFPAPHSCRVRLDHKDRTDNSFISVSRYVDWMPSDRLIGKEWMSEGKLPTDIILRIYGGANKSSEEVILELGKELDKNVAKPHSIS